MYLLDKTPFLVWCILFDRTYNSLFWQFCMHMNTHTRTPMNTRNATAHTKTLTNRIFFFSSDLFRFSNKYWTHRLHNRIISMLLWFIWLNKHKLNFSTFVESICWYISKFSLCAAFLFIVPPACVYICNISCFQHLQFRWIRIKTVLAK